MIEYTPSNPQLFFVLFVAVWVIVIKFLAFAGGWSKLAIDYASSGKFHGEKWNFQSFKLGSVNYSNCVTIGISDTHLFLRMFLPFRFGHKALAIPIYDIHGKESENMLFNYVELTISNDHASKLRLSKKLADHLEQAADGMWKYQRLN